MNRVAPVCRVTDLAVSYGPTPVVEGIGFTATDGQMLVITGPSGLVLPGMLFVAVPSVLIAATGLFAVPVAVWVGSRDPIVVLRVP